MQNALLLSAVSYFVQNSCCVKEWDYTHRMNAHHLILKETSIPFKGWSPCDISWQHGMFLCYVRELINVSLVGEVYSQTEFLSMWRNTKHYLNFNVTVYMFKSQVNYIITIIQRFIQLSLNKDVHIIIFAQILKFAGCLIRA